MATNFSPSSGSYVLNKFPSISQWSDTGPSWPFCFNEVIFFWLPWQMPHQCLQGFDWPSNGLWTNRISPKSQFTWLSMLRKRISWNHIVTMSAHPSIHPFVRDNENSLYFPYFCQVELAPTFLIFYRVSNSTFVAVQCLRISKMPERDLVLHAILPDGLLTLSQTSPGFSWSAVQVLWKHYGKRRNCSWRAISYFPTVFFFFFDTLLENFLPFSSNLTLSFANSSVWKS